MVKEDNG